MGTTNHCIPKGFAALCSIAAAFLLLLSSVPLTLAGDPGDDAARLKAALDHEYAAAGEALRRRLILLANSDEIGAAVAEREAAEHRFRYLDLRRQISRASGSIREAWRDPFATVPKASFPAPPVTSPRREESTVSGADRAWDLYAVQHSPSSTYRAFTSAERLAEGQRAQETIGGASQPFLVYRSP